MTSTVKVSFVFFLLLIGVVLAGCQSETKPEAAPSVAAPTTKPGAPAKPSNAATTDVEAAPPGVRTDLKGGLK